MTDRVTPVERLLQTELTDGWGIIDGDVRLERGDVFSRAYSRAESFRDALRPDERIAFVDTDDHEAVINILAALIAGRSLAMVPNRPEVGLEAAAAARCAAIARGPALHPVNATLNDDPRTAPSFGIERHGSPEAVVLFTSGTTGDPKGVRLSRRNVITNLTAVIRQTGRWDSGDRLGLLLALTHSYGLSMVLLALSQSAPIVMLGTATPGRATAAIIESESVNVLAAVPYYLRLLAHRGLHLGSAAFAPGLDRLFLAGGGISDQELEHVTPALEATTFLMYGFTEATARVAIRRRGDGAPSGSVGLPLPGTFVEIVGPTGAPLPPGETGTIRVSSPSLLIGFLGEEPREPGASHTTSDLGYLDEAGHLFVTGRAAEMLNFRGNRVSLPEQEARLLLLPGVEAARLVPESRDEDAQCFVQLILADGADVSELKRAALDAVEPRGLIRKIVVVKGLETTRTGKPIRRLASELDVT